MIDCSNGVGGIPLAILERLGVRYRLINHVPDGGFPNHGPDTLRAENLEQLRKAVLADRADLGVMFDGDADRVTFVDERGDTVPLDLLFLLLAQEALSRRQGTVFYDLRFSRTVKEEIEKLGGKAVMMRVGNPFYKAALHAASDGLLGAELSGHIMYSDHFGIDDPLYASLELFSILTRSGKSLSESWRAFARYAKSGEIRIETAEPARLIETAKRRFDDATISEIDGVTIEYPDFWFNLRASNTEPVAKLVIEANTPDDLELRQHQILSELRAEHSDSGPAGSSTARGQNSP